MSDNPAHRLHEAVTLHQAGDLAAARRHYEAVLRLDAGNADALHLLGVLHDQEGDHAGAARLIEQAIAQSPGVAAFHGNLATALLAQQRIAEAERAYRRAIDLDPSYVEGHYNLANLLRDRAVIGDALAHFETALRLQPGHLQARNNLAMLLWQDLDDPAAAMKHFRLLLALAPDWAAAHMNFGLMRLAAGAYAEGWREYEWRWRNADYRERDWGLGLPRWTGEPTGAAGLLLWGEQGVGDQILYGTMLRDAQARCAGPLTVAVDARLVTLFRRSLAGQGIAVVERGAPVAAAAQCPFGSLGGLLRQSEADFAAPPGGYLVADAARVTPLRDAYRGLAGPARRILGLAWRSGNTSIGVQKSIPLDLLAPVLARPDILWINLQYGDVDAELALLRRHGVAIHHDPAIDGFRDIDAFAAQIAALDGVVSVSNTAVHVAGALGVPTWLLLARGRGRLWYWPDSGETGRWYHSVHILRQTHIGDWHDVIQSIAGQLGVCR